MSDQNTPLFQSILSSSFVTKTGADSHQALDLNKLLMPHPITTFFVRVQSDAMICDNINKEDILIVDKSLTPKHNDIIIAILDGEQLVRRLIKEKDHIFLSSNGGKDLRPIEEDSDFSVWGVVTYIIHKVSS
ncbi:MAG TPA: peptidase S24 [Holosporales bacterium]|nr:peptidase S24 [Holosporales bacterium]